MLPITQQLDDVKRWDAIHQKTYQEEEAPSFYALEKEKLFPRNSLIVELGGGSGNDALYFLKQGHSVVILDISEFALKIAKDKAASLQVGSNLAIRQVDFGLHKLPITDSSIDIGYSRISLHYFDADHTSKIFADIYKMLKPGGSAYLTFKSPEDKKEMEYLQNTAVLFEPNVYIENGQLRSRFTKDQLEAMLLNAGIQEGQVIPYREELPRDSSENNPVLYLNEIIFNKKS